MKSTVSNEKNFIEGIETNYFQVSNMIFDLEFTVKANKRVIEKNYYSDGSHKYTNIDEIRKLSSIEKLVFIYICRCGNNGKAAFPSYSTISNKCNISREKARLSIEVLNNNSFILKKNRGHQADKCNQRTKSYSNIYKINGDLKSLSSKKGVSYCGTV